jgi:hypothetical protein
MSQFNFLSVFKRLQAEKASINREALTALAERLAELASDVGGEELAGEGYLSKLEELRWVSPSGSCSTRAEPIVAAWIKNGAIWSCPWARKNGLAAKMILRDPMRWIDAIAPDQRWHVATCPKRFDEEIRRGVAWDLVAQTTTLSLEEWSRARAFLISEQTRKETWISARKRRALLDRSDACGRLETLRETGRGHVWLMMCMAFGDEELVGRAASAGLRLDAATPEEAGHLAAVLLSRSFEGGSEDFTRMQRSLAEDRETKAKRRELEQSEHERVGRWWRQAIALGLPEPDWTPCLQSFGETAGKFRHFQPARFFSLLGEEAARSGLGGAKSLLWTKAAFAQEWTPALVGRLGAEAGQSAIGWAWARGLDRVWSHERLSDAMRVRASVEGSRTKAAAKALAELADLGAKLAPKKPMEEHPAAQAATAGLAVEALGSLLRMGASLSRGKGQSELARGEPSLMETLLSGGEKSLRWAVAALDAAEAAKKGGARALLMEKGPGGRTGAHWAARAASAKGLALVIERGGDPLARDDEGRGALHELAARHGKKAEANALAIVKTLAESGYDWTAADNKGRAPLDEMAKRGPIDAIEEILRQAPSAANPRGPEGQGAIEKLRERGGDALARVESLLLRQELAAKAASAEAAGGEKTTAKGLAGCDAQNPENRAETTGADAVPGGGEGTPAKKRAPRRM